MAAEPIKRQRRNPLTHQEVAKLIEIKKKRELIALQKLKGSFSYKIQNIFNITCFFVYCEIILCYFGPCSYASHYTHNVVPRFGNLIQKDGKYILADIDFLCVNGSTYKLIVDDFVDLPEKKTKFVIASDFLLRKEIKGSFNSSQKMYRVFAASPILFLSTLLLVVLFIAFAYNLNENAYSLLGLTMLNSINLLGILFL